MRITILGGLSDCLIKSTLCNKYMNALAVQVIMFFKLNRINLTFYIKQKLKSILINSF